MPALLRPRFYDALFADHMAHYRQMLIVVGPRQVGKTTTCRALSSAYLNWDNTDDRQLLLRGPTALAAHFGLERLRAKPPVVTLDELHKFRQWRGLIKGFFDTYADRVRIVVTGSSRLDVYRRGGDSLMGRYFLCRMHPFSVAETAHTQTTTRLIAKPTAIADADFNALWRHGGYPEPFLRRDARFSTRWRTLRRQQLVREDIRDLTSIHDLAQMELLGSLLTESSGTSLIYSNLARELRVSVDTVRRWVAVFCTLHLGFIVRPYFKNVAKALRKEPKWFLRDWSSIDDPGARYETFVACHLLKAVEGWQDQGLGELDLYYLRDKQKREVDFLVVRNRQPWFLVEAKKAETQLSPALAYFQKQVKAAHAFQVVLDLDYVEADCFLRHEPTVVPARTFLSQLL